MARREFPKAVKVAVIKRCTRDSVIYCEACAGMAKRYQIDHVIPDALGGEPILTNAQLLCEGCYSVKNPQDTKDAAKAKRREAKHLGAAKTKGSIPAPPPKREKGFTDPFPNLPRRRMFA